MQIGVSLSLTQPRGSGGTFTPALAAPGNFDVETNELDFSASFDAVVDADEYEWALDDGDFTNIGSTLSFEGSSTAGLHTLTVRALSDTGRPGEVSVSDPFTLVAPANLFFAPAEDLMFDPAGDLMFA
jgi:hypothetical protein